MSRGRFLAYVAAVVLALSAPLGSDAAASQATQRYIVVWADWVDPDTETDAFERNAKVKADFRYSHAIKGFAAALGAAHLAALSRHPKVKFVSPDREVHAIGSVPIVASDSAPTGIRRIDAASTTTASEASTVGVAVLDTGIQLTHPDLNAVAGKNCITSGASPNDDNGHGTHVSGTIGGRNNGAGVVGVAPATTLYAVKVLNAQGSGSWGHVICGIDWITANAAALNIKVASMSLGSSGSNDNNCGNSNSDALHQAICRSTAAGVTYVVAAGNSAVNFADDVPASYPEALTVTAMSDSDGLAGGTGGAPTCRPGETDDAFATFSNFAVAATEQNHTIAGPGVCTHSTWLGSGYNTISGTSMSTPHVAGTVALCLGSGGAAGPCNGMTPAQIIQKIRADAQARATAANGFTGDPLHPVSGKYFGFLAFAGTPIPDTTPPTVTTTSPTDGATAVPVAANVTATFSEAMLASSITTASVMLVVQGTTGVIAATVTYNAASLIATLNPTADLTPSTTYLATIKSGDSGVKDAAGNPLAVDATWTFTTAAAPPPSTFPVVQSVTASTFVTDATSHQVALPAVVSAGDLLVCLFTSDGNATVTAPSGWTQIGTATNGTTVRLSVHLRVASGTEGGTTHNFATAAAEKAAAHVYRISGWYGGTISGADGAGYSLATASGAASATPNPPLLNPGTWDVENVLWLAVEAVDNLTGAVTPPSSYTNALASNTPTDTGRVSLASARRSNAVAAEDPAVFTNVYTQPWITATLAIRPGTAGAEISAAGPTTSRTAEARSP